jgi:hypothetical protein
MKHFSGIFLLLITAFAGRGQTEVKKFQLIEDIYNQWKKHHIGKTNTACDTFLYADYIHPDLFDGIKDLVKEETTIVRRVHLTPLTWADTTNAERIKFTRAEIDFVIKELDRVKKSLWADNIFTDAQLVPLNTINRLFKNIDLAKDSLMKKLCYKIHFFSSPIFLRHSTLCFFYFGEADILGQKGEHWLYRKENNVWKEFRRIGVWFN